jgi:hypothetical protein
VQPHRIAIVFFAVIAAMLLVASSALAFRGHEFAFSFGEAGSGNGQFAGPTDVAVNDATGQVYVLDQGNARVERFGLTGNSATYEAQWGGGETPAGSFSWPADNVNPSKEAQVGGIAVDNSCFLQKLSGSACASADPSNGDVYITDPGHGVVDKFDANGKYLGQLDEQPGVPFNFNDELSGVAVDPTGGVFVYWEDGLGFVFGAVTSFTNGEPNVPISTHQLRSTGEDFMAPGFAVAPNGDLYARRRHQAIFYVSKYASTGPILRAPFVSEETSAVAVDLATSEVFLDNLTSVGAFSPAATLEERLGEEGGAKHLQEGSGLAVGNESANPRNTTIYVADVKADVVDVFSPEPPGAPIVQSESTAVFDVSADSASFAAEVDPHGAGTTYRFEYGSCGSAFTCEGSPYTQSVPVPDGFAGSDFEFHTVGVRPSDLTGGAFYHFRVVARNEAKGKVNEVAGEERMFKTQGADAFSLPDGREWEMVSPAQKKGALIFSSSTSKGGALAQASASGDAMTYVASAPTEAAPQGYNNGVQVLSARGPSGWSSRDLTVPHLAATGEPVGNGHEYRFFSEDLSLAIAQPFGGFDPEISEEASEQTALLHSNFLEGDAANPCMTHCYRPLVSEANTEGSAFGEEGKCPPQSICGPLFVGATPDASHIVLRSNAKLTEGGPNGPGLYEWSAGRLQFLSLLPKGGAASQPTFGHGSASAKNAISEDGTRIFWMAEDHIYMTDSVREESIQLDVAQKGAAGGGGGVSQFAEGFHAASKDGSRMFFTDGQRLTSDSGAGTEVGEADLYECVIVEGEGGKLQCELSDLTPAQGKGADVVGSVSVSEDGSYVYFVANGVLAEGAVAGDCQNETVKASERCNLYERHFNGVEWEAPRLVAVLSGADGPDWEPFGRGTTRLSPNGRWFTFMSEQPLTGYDNRDAQSNVRDEEVFLYDAASGQLRCVSCDPSGARPVGEQFARLGEAGAQGTTKLGGLAGGYPGWPEERWLAADIPGWTTISVIEVRHQPRYLSDSGRLYFNAHDALASHDVNGQWDVYQYEPPGVGNCTSEDPAYNPSAGGCVSLISSGESAEESALLDVSESGSDVFFLTDSKLDRAKDFDSALDVYDAHECTTPSPCLPAETGVLPPCESESACRAGRSPQPAIFGAPASATFAGAGNISPALTVRKATAKGLTRTQKLARALSACRKRYRHSARKRAACEKHARHEFGVKHGKSAARGKGLFKTGFVQGVGGSAR